MFTLFDCDLLLVIFCIPVYTAQLNKDVISSCHPLTCAWVRSWFQSHPLKMISSRYCAFSRVCLVFCLASCKASQNVNICNCLHEANRDGPLGPNADYLTWSKSTAVLDAKLSVMHCHNFEIQNALVSKQRTLLSWKGVNRYKFSTLICLMTIKPWVA